LARYLALDWDHNQLYVVLANVAGGSVRVQRAAVWTEEAPLSMANAALVGERLRERLKEAKIPAAPVLAGLGRDRVIVKDIRYPVVPAHEEPAVVRFQAIKELTGAAEDVAIDYMPVGDTGGERRTMVLVAKRELVTAYQELCKSAGLKLAGVTPRPFGLATCIERLAGTTVLTPPPEPKDSAVGVLAVAEGWAEFTVSRGGTLLLARSLTPGPNLAAEVRRSLAVYAGQNATQPVRAVYVSGAADNVALRERLHNLTELPVHLLDPFAGSDLPDTVAPDKRGGYVGLVGLLHLRGDRAGLPVNFAEPKQPKPPADPNKRKLLLGAAVAAALLLAGGALAYFELGRLDREVSAQLAKNNEMSKLLTEQLEEDDKRIKAIGSWVDQNVVWLDELYDLTDRFPDPDTDRVRLTQLSAKVVERSTNPKDKDKQPLFAADMSLKGVCGDDYKPIDGLLSRFTADGYPHSPKHLQPQRVLGRQSGYSQEFTIARLDIKRREPTQYTHHIPDEGEAGKERERPGGGRRGGGGPRRAGE
jgi:Tfp pilus assembly PilM family ATPase